MESQSKLKNQRVRKSNKIDIRKLEVRKIQSYNDNTHFTAPPAGRKKQSKTFINRWNFYNVKKTRFVATYSKTSHQNVLASIDLWVGNE